MSTELTPLSPEAIDSLAQIVGDRYSGSQITRLFQRSGFPDVVHDGSTKWRFVAAIFLQMQAIEGNRPHRILKVIKTMCNPEGYIGNRDGFEATLKAVNEALAFYGLRMEDDGNLKRTSERVSTIKHTKSEDETAFDFRGLHPEVVRHGRAHFSRGAYFHAVFEVCKAFDAAVRTNSGLDKSGQPLMSWALCLKGPIKLNSQTTQSERDEQEGIMFLAMGLMNAIRNPQAHEPELNWPMSRGESLDVLALTSFLFRKLEDSVVLREGSAGAVKVQL